MKYADNLVGEFDFTWDFASATVFCFLSNGTLNSFNYNVTSNGHWYNGKDLFTYVSSHYLSGTSVSSGTKLLGFCYSDPFSVGGTHNYNEMHLYLTSECDYVFISDDDSSVIENGDISFAFTNNHLNDYDTSQSSYTSFVQNYYTLVSYQNAVFYDNTVLQDPSDYYENIGGLYGVDQNNNVVPSLLAVPKGEGVIVDWANFEYTIEPTPGAFIGDYVQAGGVSYNLNFLEIHRFAYEEIELSLDFGNAYNHHYQEAYYNGVGVGEDYGFSRGYDKGYEKGFYDGSTTGGTVETNRAFGIISGAFNTVSSVMSLEILPNVTIGLAFSIPLVFILIMTIFKLVRK